MSTQSAIIVTHQSRIRCLMHMYGIGILGSASVAMGDDDLNERLLGDESNVGSPSIAGGGGARTDACCEYVSRATRLMCH